MEIKGNAALRTRACAENLIRVASSALLPRWSIISEIFEIYNLRVHRIERRNARLLARLCARVRVSDINLAASPCANDSCIALVARSFRNISHAPNTFRSLKRQNSRARVHDGSLAFDSSSASPSLNPDTSRNHLAVLTARVTWLLEKGDDVERLACNSPVCLLFANIRRLAIAFVDNSIK